MKKALDALQAARSAERIYLRGKTRAVVVDIDRVRLQGKDKGAPSVRTPRPPADPARDKRIARFDVALAARAHGAVRRRRLAAPPAPRSCLDQRDMGAARAIENAANALRGGHERHGRADSRTAARSRQFRRAPSALTAWRVPPP